ncbi:MAG: VOC family protein [Pseudooceanicola sp.]|uniref:VOC family protein n=1 Tax=Pseudooceanicola nanhaiensis TaxID=375761 RepID=UPI004059609B
MQPNIYLFFNGTCAEAMRTYGRIFGAEPEILPASTMPPEVKAQMPGMPDDAVMHAALQVGDGWIYASDDFEGTNPPMAGCSLSVGLSTVEETTRVFDALAEGGEVRQPLRAEFFSPAFGALTDRFGTRWMIMADQPEEPAAA